MLCQGIALLAPLEKFLVCRAGEAGQAWTRSTRQRFSTLLLLLGVTFWKRSTSGGSAVSTRPWLGRLSGSNSKPSVVWPRIGN